MKVLVTGSEGYIGSRLVPLLVERGHAVTGLDTGFYCDGQLYDTTPVPYRKVSKDVREVTQEDVAGHDAVVHLGELSNDPLGQFHPEVTYAINHLGSVHLAAVCKRAGVERFAYASSCSVYGAAGSEDFKTEESAVNPQTAYADCKVLVERDVSAMADDNFSPTFLRNSTAFGLSPHMRFDIVLNNLAGLAQTTGQVRLTSDGTPWRPLVHVLDIGAAIACALEAPRNVIHDEVFNVGDNQANYQVRDIAEIVAEVFPACSLEIGTGDADNRSYRVRFDKIHDRLPNFRCRWDARKGAEELRDKFVEIAMGRDAFEYRAFTRLKQLAFLLDTGQIDGDYRWI